MDYNEIVKFKLSVAKHFPAFAGTQCQLNLSLVWLNIFLLLQAHSVSLCGQVDGLQHQVSGGGNSPTTLLCLSHTLVGGRDNQMDKMQTVSICGMQMPTCGMIMRVMDPAMLHLNVMFVRLVCFETLATHTIIG